MYSFSANFLGGGEEIGSHLYKINVIKVTKIGIKKKAAQW